MKVYCRDIPTKFQLVHKNSLLMYSARNTPYFNLACREPLGDPSEHAMFEDVGYIATFKVIREDEDLVIMSAGVATDKTIAEWEARHKDTELWRFDTPSYRRMKANV